jgi:hypothetical protein
MEVLCVACTHIKYENQQNNAYAYALMMVSLLEHKGALGQSPMVMPLESKRQ